MRVRFVTSIPGFVEGREIEADPPPAIFLDWLRGGIVEAVREGPSLALAPDVVEQAVTRRQQAARPRKGKRKVVATASADGEP